MRQGEEVRAQSVMGGMQQGVEQRRFCDQELPEGIGMRELGQAGQVLEHPVGTEQGFELDRIQAQHHRIHHGEQALGDAEVVIALFHTQTKAEECPQEQLLKEYVEQVHASEVREVSCRE